MLALPALSGHCSNRCWRGPAANTKHWCCCRQAFVDRPKLDWRAHGTPLTGPAACHYLEAALLSAFMLLFNNLVKALKLDIHAALFGNVSTCTPMCSTTATWPSVFLRSASWRPSLCSLLAGQAGAVQGRRRRAAHRDALHPLHLAGQPPRRTAQQPGLRAHHPHVAQFPCFHLSPSSTPP